MNKNFLYILLIIFPLSLIAYNWWYAVLISRETKRKNPLKRLIWIVAGLILGPRITTIYTAKHNAETRQPQPASFIGLTTGAKLQKNTRIFLLILFSVWLILNIISTLNNNASLKEFLTKTGADQILFWRIVFPIIMIIYFLFSPTKEKKLNPLDKPLWGMKETPEGNIDESLTKHKKTVKFLIWLIVIIFILCILLIIYNIFIVPSTPTIK